MSTGETRLLIAAGEAVADLDELPDLIRGLIESASEILVVSPVLVGRLRWLASDTDRARYEADERLGAVLSHVQELAPAAEARAQVGDETPLTAFEDAIRVFRPDHILVALRGTDHAAWQERGLIDSVLAAFHLPITVFEIDRARQVPREGGSLAPTEGAGARQQGPSPATMFTGVGVVVTPFYCACSRVRARLGSDARKARSSRSGPGPTNTLMGVGTVFAFYARARGCAGE